MITIKEQTNCVLNRKEQLDLDLWPMMMFFFFFFLYINMMFGQLCICYVLVKRSFTKLLMTTNEKRIYLQFWRQAKAK